MSFTVRFDDHHQEIIFGGVMRPKAADELQVVHDAVKEALQCISGTLSLNFKRLNNLNNVAFRELAAIFGDVCEQQPQLQLKIICSSVVGWAMRKFQLLARISPNIAVEHYDRNFYPGQRVLEDGSFIPALRAQTKMTWRHERHILPRHGLRPEMHVADICCGVGDFAALVQKEFKPGRMLALDHARSSLDYARKAAAESGITDIEYIYGDAAALLLEDDEFDFVMCRHALQVFNEPELIVKELYRICKPGGRVYITNEKISECAGEPYSESIQWTYREVAKLFAHFDMDAECGPKGQRLLQEGGFDDLKMEMFIVTNRESNPRDFADMIQAWENVYAGKMSAARGDSPEFNARFRRGFQDHMATALDPKGYAAWPIWVASGRKPL